MGGEAKKSSGKKKAAASSDAKKKITSTKQKSSPQKKITRKSAGVGVISKSEQSAVIEEAKKSSDTGVTGQHPTTVAQEDKEETQSEKKDSMNVVVEDHEVEEEIVDEVLIEENGASNSSTDIIEMLDETETSDIVVENDGEKLIFESNTISSDDGENDDDKSVKSKITDPAKSDERSSSLRENVGQSNASGKIYSVFSFKDSKARVVDCCVFPTNARASLSIAESLLPRAAYIPGKSNIVVGTELRADKVVVLGSDNSIFDLDVCKISDAQKETGDIKQSPRYDRVSGYNSLFSAEDAALFIFVSDYYNRAAPGAGNGNTSPSQTQNRSPGVYSFKVFVVSDKATSAKRWATAAIETLKTSGEYPDLFPKDTNFVQMLDVTDPIVFEDNAIDGRFLFPSLSRTGNNKYRGDFKVAMKQDEMRRNSTNGFFV